MYMAKLNSARAWARNRIRLLERQFYYDCLKGYKGDFLALNDFLYPGAAYERRSIDGGIVTRFSPLLLDDRMHHFMKELAVIRPRNAFDALHDSLPARTPTFVKRFIADLADYFGTPQWQYRDPWYGHQRRRKRRTRGYFYKRKQRRSFSFHHHNAMRRILTDSPEELAHFSRGRRFRHDVRKG